MTRTVAALYVDRERGPYRAIHGVDVWDEARDASRYAGPWPVVAHPPCGPWGRLRHMCGAALLAQEWLGPLAVEQVRTWGGVLEHPADSKLWQACNMPRPGGLPDASGGFTLAIEQWFWGHEAVKPTWLYVVGASVPPMPPRPTTARPASGGIEARKRDPKLRSMVERMSANKRHLTPPAFAEWLVELARSVRSRFDDE